MKRFFNKKLWRKVIVVVVGMLIAFLFLVQGGKVRPNWENALGKSVGVIVFGATLLFLLKEDKRQ